jgi:hypothetical protein
VLCCTPFNVPRGKGDALTLPEGANSPERFTGAAAASLSKIEQTGTRGPLVLVLHGDQRYSPVHTQASIAAGSSA